MTQGSTMNPTTPAAAIAPATVPATPTILSRWRESQQHSSTQHAFYALARLIHSAKKAKDDSYVNSEHFYKAALKKLVRTFGPVRKPSKLNNGVKPFGALFAELSYRKAIKGSLGTAWEEHWGVSSDEIDEIAALANELFMLARQLGNSGLLALAPAEPPARVKKPYVRPA